MSMHAGPGPRPWTLGLWTLGLGPGRVLDPGPGHWAWALGPTLKARMEICSFLRFLAINDGQWLNVTELYMIPAWNTGTPEQMHS